MFETALLCFYDAINKVEVTLYIDTYADSLRQVTEEFHKFKTYHILPRNFRSTERPVLFNSWEALYFDFDRDKLLSVANEAANMGMELCVADDGWFVGRNNSCAGLGDWQDDACKTGGIDNLSAEVKKLGLKFGIWVEPEMINKISGIYRTHPEYAMTCAGDNNPTERRSQLVMDIVNPEVADYIFRALCDVFDKCNPDYVKWDCNRFLTDIYSSYCKNAGGIAIITCVRYIRCLINLQNVIPIYFSRGVQRTETGLI